MTQQRKAECCGFGGTFAVKQADVSGAMVQDKTDALRATAAQCVISQDCGCLDEHWRRIREAGRRPANPPCRRISVGTAGTHHEPDPGVSPTHRRRHCTTTSCTQLPLLRMTGIQATSGRPSSPTTGSCRSLREQAHGTRQCAGKTARASEQLEARLTANGIQVHWAETLRNRPIRSSAISCRPPAPESVVKGKSMVSEETELNHYLEQLGVEVIRVRSPEFIIQLAQEPPSYRRPGDPQELP